MLVIAKDAGLILIVITTEVLEQIISGDIFTNVVSHVDHVVFEKIQYREGRWSKQFTNLLLESTVTDSKSVLALCYFSQLVQLTLEFESTSLLPSGGLLGR